ncbi:PH domain-containing protein [Luteimicrobium subarcticum]|uniref:PH (Pleckstrin Homology) domain-containing protein n=1 Tax=Luteimicrobium subarcticum TaxID=620910 RepID=A0A2M8W3T4_9MICO|nr:PH domain-containing protein [Luteimicrobium subarcticum]PJI85588.1 PH (Pleckstrin Homology) domain-containing protein [Luteimicrobium subarcticum]
MRVTPHTDRPADAWLYAPFRPRFALFAGALTATVLVGGCAFVALAARQTGFDSGQRVAIVVVGLLGAWFLELLVNTSARPTPDGLTVRNVVHRRRLEWAEVVAVRFAPADPWVVLDLADGTTLAVMAVQRADGARGVRDANRLARLVALHGEAPDRAP